MCVALLVSPIVWGHYLVLATLPIAVLVQRIAHAELTRTGSIAGTTVLAMLVCLPLLTSPDVLAAPDAG